MKYLVLLALLGSVSCQNTLNSYTGIRNSLIDGNELTLNAFSIGCRAAVNVTNNIVVSMTLRHWQIVDPSAGAEEIRSDDYYIDTQDVDAITYVTRTANIYSDNSVRLLITFNDVGTGESNGFLLDCILGEGAIAHEIIGGGIADVNNYATLKRDLLLGDHVEAVGYLSGCQGSQQFDANFIIGYQIQRFSIFGDGTPEQFIVFDDTAVFANSGTGVAIGVETLRAFPNNTAFVDISVLSPDLSVITSFSLTCLLGADLSFFVHRRESPGSYVTYQQIKDATLAGHDMEMVTFLTYCDVVEGEQFDFTGRIGAARFDEFQLFKAGGVWGDVEYIAYSTWGISNTGQVFVDVARVYEDGQLTVEYFGTGLDGAAPIAGLVNCPLGVGSLFHAVNRDRRPLTEYNEVVGGILGNGRVYEIEIDYDSCSNGSPLPLNSIFGGIAWQSYIAPGDDGFFYADLSSVVPVGDGESQGLAWNAASVAILPNNTVIITANSYDFFTGASLLGEIPAPPAPIICTLGRGVQFFPYP